ARSRPASIARIIALSVASLVAPAAAAHAALQPVHDGPELILGHSENKQLVEAHRPAVARNESGAFVVAWEKRYYYPHESQIVFERFDSAGTQLDAQPVTVAHDPNEFHQSPDVAMDPDGGFVVVWVHSYDMLSRRYGSDGQPLDPNAVPLSASPGRRFEPPRLAMNRSGEYVVAWSTKAGQVVARRFMPGGVPEDPTEFVVTVDPNGRGYDVETDLNESGQFAVVWAGSDAAGNDPSGVFMRRFDGDGQPLDASESQVNTFTTFAQRNPAVSVDESGRVVVVWQSNHNVGNEVYARRYAPDGTALDAEEFLVHHRRVEDQQNPDIFSDDAGNFTVAFQAQDSSARGIFARRFKRDGAPLDAIEFQINTTTTDNQRQPVISGSGSGDFVAAWQSEEDSNKLNSSIDVAAQRIAFVPGAPPPPVRQPRVIFPPPAWTLDCADPSDPNARPEFQWLAGDYEKFKVLMAGSPAFDKGTRVSSGKKKIAGTSWIPNEKRWRNACLKAQAGGSHIYVKVLAVAPYMSKNDPRRKTESFAVTAITSP
ncbi:MAG TPA: hypothetical protein VNI57_11840, partial [Candidatus Saccharimonadales bacterium]|nr:hypothetical protein [Candidatus Saccharimonadales bacterium]